MKKFSVIDTSDGCEIHGFGCSHIKRTEGSMKAIRAAKTYTGESAKDVFEQWLSEMETDFPDAADLFTGHVLPCAGKV